MPESAKTAYRVDRNIVSAKAYQLLTLFYASREIARRADPATPDDPASLLQEQFLPTTMTHLLLEIAIHMRTLDDQFQRADAKSSVAKIYLEHRNFIDCRHKGLICLFDDFGVRQVFNKIIHADLVEPHFQDGSSNHEIDHQNYLGWSIAMEEDGVDYPKPDSIKWKHLSDHVRLSGEHKGKRWYSLLDVPGFISAVYHLLDLDNNGEDAP